MHTIELSGSYSQTQEKILLAPPPGFLLAKWLQQYQVPGAYRFERLLRDIGYLNVLVRYPLSRRTFIDMPIGLPLRDVTALEVATYEKDSVRTAGAIVGSWNLPVTLIDCGADVGLMSAKLVDRCGNIQQVVAFEPNEKIYQYLRHNIDSLPVEGRAHCSAIADYRGRGKLAHDGLDLSDHGAFLAACQDGPIDVVRIDDLGLRPGGGLVLKVDVEGGELAVLRGAKESIANAERFLILFEAHPRHVKRTGVDPCDLVRFIQDMRPCEAKISECPEVKLRLDRKFFEQLDPYRIFNVCVYTA